MTRQQSALRRGLVGSAHQLGHQAVAVLAAEILLQGVHGCGRLGQEHECRLWSNARQQQLRQFAVGAVVALALGRETDQVFGGSTPGRDLNQTAACRCPANRIGHAITTSLDPQIGYGLGDVVQQRDEEHHVAPLVALRIDLLDLRATG